MKAELDKLCTEYIANRDEIQKAFRWEKSAVQAACANIFCACGQTADKDRLLACRNLIRKETGLFSRFRGKTRPILACILALGENPQDRMSLAAGYYDLLKNHFKKTDYLVLTSILLTDLAEKSLTEEKAARGKEIFLRMKKKHRFLTNDMDSVFAVLMAFSEKTDDELTADMEACYQALKTRFSSSAAQTVSQVLCTAAGAPEEKVQRVIDLYSALLEADVKYGNSGDLAPLAALSLADAPISVLTEEIKEVYLFLKTQKGYSAGNKEQEQRALHAVMIVSDQYTGTNQVNAAVLTNTLEMLIASQRATQVSLAMNLLQIAAEFLGAAKGEPDQADDGAEQKAEPEKQKET